MKGAVNWIWLNPAMGIVGALVIARWSWSLMRDTAAVLLDTSDARLEAEVREHVEVSGDVRITDLHVWRIGPEAHAAIVSVTGSGAADSEAIRARLAPVHELAHVHSGMPVDPGTAQGRSLCNPFNPADPTATAQGRVDSFV